MVSFPTQIIDSNSQSPAVLDLLLFSDTSICSTMVFSPLVTSDHVVVSVFIGFLSSAQQHTLFHCIAYDYSFANLDGLCGHLGDIPWNDIFQLSVLLLLIYVNFVSVFRLELIYISLIVNIRSSLTHLHGFQLLVLLPYFIEITFFVCTNRINLLNLK